MELACYHKRVSTKAPVEWGQERPVGKQTDWPTAISISLIPHAAYPLGRVRYEYP